MKKTVLALALLALAGCTIDGSDAYSAVEFCASRGGLYYMDVAGTVACNNGTVAGIREVRKDVANKHMQQPTKE
jgi:hypothetical protein